MVQVQQQKLKIDQQIKKIIQYEDRISGLVLGNDWLQKRIKSMEAEAAQFRTRIQLFESSQQ